MTKAHRILYQVTLASGAIVTSPQGFGDDSQVGQAWFWTPEWQAGERRASEDIAADRVSIHKTDEDFLAFLADEEEE